MESELPLGFLLFIKIFPRITSSKMFQPLKKCFNRSQKWIKPFEKGFDHAEKFPVRRRPKDCNQKGGNKKKGGLSTFCVWIFASF